MGVRVRESGRENGRSRKRIRKRKWAFAQENPECGFSYANEDFLFCFTTNASRTEESGAGECRGEPSQGARRSQAKVLDGGACFGARGEACGRPVLEVSAVWVLGSMDGVDLLSGLDCDLWGPRLMKSRAPQSIFDS
ncbi:uncharacterized protein LOC134779091 [Penaeus indicus]|uniref:uncharacterized protein LOC134779091 n=1 Tax=Penaeus indicus TaxID=29960 RepID=UPI00300D807B